MEGIKWPVDNCVNCGKDLTGVEAREKEKSRSKDGEDSWSDHCPQCGKGYIVGKRGAPIQRGVSAKIITSQAEILATAPGGRKAGAGPTDDLYNPDKPHGPRRDTLKGEFWCTKCAGIHRESSKQGTNHLKYKEA